MKKILLVGELNQTLSSVNRFLSSRFATQVCTDSLEMVKGLLSVFSPDMVVVCLMGTDNLDKHILDYISNRCPEMPILLLGTIQECRGYDEYYRKDKFDYILRPITMAQLLEKCLRVLRIDAGEPIKDLSGRADSEQKKRILAVDDSGILLRSVKVMLEPEYEVVFATDGKLALQQAKKTQPDLVLLDYEMPGWDGKRTLEEFRKDEQLKNIPVVFLTGVADKNHIMSVVDLKPEGYLLKPIEKQRLADTIEGVFSGMV